MDDKQQEKREARRKRRIRNQIIAYIVVMLFITAAAAGVVLGIRHFSNQRQNAEESQQSNQEALDNLLATEPEIPTPSPEPESESSQVVEQTPEEKLDQIVNALIDVMPLEDKVANLFIVTPESITGVGTAVKGGEGTKDALTRYAVGGIVYSAKNIKSEEQFKEMLENTRNYSKYDLFLTVEEEGGKLSPVTNAGIGTKADSARAIGETGDTNAAYEAGANLGAALSGVGINLDLAPVADLSTAEDSWLKERSYGSGAQAVATMVNSCIQGLESQGVTSCVKFFPGVGGTKEDPAKGLAGTDRTEEQFRSEEFLTFQAAIDAGADMIMVSSASAPALTGGNEPCIFSGKVVTDILRDELGFGGVIISDSLSVKAVSDYYGADEAAVMALKAGCDMLYMPEDFEKAYNGILQAVREGTISEERINDALLRIYRIKYADKIEE